MRCLDEFFDGRRSGPPLLLAEDVPDVPASPESRGGDGEPAGFAFLEPAVDYFSGDRHGHLGMIAVTERAEGQGVGAALMRAAEGWARANGYAKLTLNVFAGNTRARDVYERFGYRVETVRYVKAIE